VRAATGGRAVASKPASTATDRSAVRLAELANLPNPLRQPDLAGRRRGAGRKLFNIVAVQRRSNRKNT
jgi:hypothetical protein